MYYGRGEKGCNQCQAAGECSWRKPDHHMKLGWFVLAIIHYSF